MSRRGYLALLAGLLFAVSQSAAPVSADPPTRSQIRSLLSGYEFVPTAEQIQSLGHEALPLLIELANDGAEPPFVRLRAVRLTAAFPTPATRTFLLAMVRAPNQSDLMMRQAVLALGQAFGERCIPDVAPFLSHRDPVVREAAVRALSRVGTNDARERIRRRMAQETSPHLRREIRRALARGR
ncbi:MAG: HEAT repeat domain-containing protein [Myxococcota bacterium]